MLEEKIVKNEDNEKPTIIKKQSKRKSKRKSKTDSDDSKPSDNPEVGSNRKDELEISMARRSLAPRKSYSRLMGMNGEVQEMPVKEPEGNYMDPSSYDGSNDFQLVAQKDGSEVVKKKGSGKGGGDGFMKAAQSQALRPFVIISSSYLLFTITDGAIRMIVLQHAYNKSFSAMQVAVMFTLYELAGVFTNLVRDIGEMRCISS